MPNEQQEWLEEELQRPVGTETGVEFLGPVGAGIVAAHLLSAWPSSPQGLAAKQLVEACEMGQDLAQQDVRRHRCLGQDCGHATSLREFSDALQAARKAGLA